MELFSLIKLQPSSFHTKDWSKMNFSLQYQYYVKKEGIKKKKMSTMGYCLT